MNIHGWIQARYTTPTPDEVVLWNHSMQDDRFRMAMLVTLLQGLEERRRLARAEHYHRIARLKADGKYEEFIKIKMERNKRYRKPPIPKAPKPAKPPKVVIVKPVKIPMTHEERLARARDSYAKQMRDPVARQKHRDRVKKAAAKLRESGHTNAYMRKRRISDIRVRLTENLRRRLNEVLHGLAKADSVSRLVGCSIDELKSHLESKFEPWMTWENYGSGDGKWVIDHIKPCSAFDMADPEQQRLCFNYTNLQPLAWKVNNQKKSKHAGKHWGKYRWACTP